MLTAASHFHFCVIGDRTVGLDLRTNRYACLAGAAHGGLRDEGRLPGSGDRTALAPLIARGWLIEGDGSVILPCPHRKADRTAPGATAAFDRLAPIRIGWALARTKLALRTRSLESILAARSGGPPVTCCEALIAADRLFNQARLYVPVKRNCLLDALAELVFLGGRGLRAELVFGVGLNPFAAHCWLEAENVVLGDEPENIAPFTPILRLS